MELDVQKVDPYGRLLAYIYLPDGQMFNETLVEEGYAQVATFPPNVRYVDRFPKAQREARAANRGLWGLSEEELCQQTNCGNGIGGGCSGSGAEPQPIHEQGDAEGGTRGSDADLNSPQHQVEITGAESGEGTGADSPSSLERFGQPTLGA